MIFVISFVLNLYSIVSIIFLSDSLISCEVFLLFWFSEITIVNSPFGSILINECVKQNINIIPLPGPSAVSTAVSISGFGGKYLFYGFFPEKEKIIISEIEKLSSLEFCLVFFISPKKINKIIPYLNNYFADRKILICREISKYYEEYMRFSLGKLKPFKIEPKGELTIVISENQNNNNTS